MLVERGIHLSVHVLPPIAYVGRVVFLIVTTIIFVIALLAYLRLRNRKTLLLGVGFGLFFAHGLIGIAELLSSTFNYDFTEGWHLLLDAAALLVILIGTLKD